MKKDPFDGLIPLDTARGGGSNSSHDRARSWPLPREISVDEVRAPKFPTSALPDVVRTYVEENSERNCVPPDIMAATAIVGMGSLVGGRIAVKPLAGGDWLATPNCWGLGVDDPGAMKSQQMSAALGAHRSLQKEAADRFASEVAKWNELPPDEQKTTPEPTLKVLLTSDATYERIGAILATNPNGVLIECDEITGLLKSLSRDDASKARAFFLTAWEGSGGYTFDRVIRGRVHIERAIVSLFGCIQPGVLRGIVNSVVEGSKGSDGFFERFAMIAAPDEKIEYRVPAGDGNFCRKAKFHDAMKRLARLEIARVGREIEPFSGRPFLRFDPDAQQTFDQAYERLRNFQHDHGAHPMFRAWASKLGKAVAGWALVDHLMEGGHGSIGLRSTERALRLADYAERQAARLFSGERDVDADRAALALLGKLRAGKLADGFTRREVQRRCWSGLTTNKQIEGALSVLLGSGHLRAEKVETGSAERLARYSIHPTVGRSN